MTPHEDSQCIGHEPCPACGSRDNLGRYSDGHGWCFGCGHYDAGTGATVVVAKRVSGEFLTGEVQALVKRNLTEDACRKYGYMVGRDKGRPVQIANYRTPEGELVAQKVRTPDKEFYIVGSGSNLPPYGIHLWKAGGRRCIVTEGEIDCISIAQVLGLSWPVVSVPGGAKSAKSCIQRHLEWFESFDQVVLAFDSDDVGRQAAADCAPLFSPGKCSVWEPSRKDANEMLVAGETKELVSAIYQAREYRPDGIVTLDEIEDKVLGDPLPGLPWFLPTLTAATYGRRPGDVIGLGGGTGCGKSDFIVQQVAFDVVTLGLPVGVLFLEQAVSETGRRIAGKIAGRRFHVPEDGWTKEELKAAWGKLKATGNLHLYDSFGAMDWDTIKSKVRYMVTSLGCKVVYLDHLTALAAAVDTDERKALDGILADIAGMATALQFVFVYVSHLATPDGTPHEENGRVMVKHFRGSRAIGFWSHNIFGIERNTQTPGQPSVLRCLKDRHTGQSLGKTIGMNYDPRTGLLSECDVPSPFEDESGGSRLDF